MDECRLLGRVVEVRERVEGSVGVLREVRREEDALEEVFAADGRLFGCPLDAVTSNGTTVVRARFRAVEPMMRFSSGLWPREPTIDMSARTVSAIPLIRR